MRFVVTRDGPDFAARARPFMEPRIECNLLMTVLEIALANRAPERRPLFAYGLDQDEHVRFAALRTPPWFMLASKLGEAEAHELVATWLEADPELPGVDGPPETARAIAAAWSAQTGRCTECSMREAMHVLTDVEDPPRIARGELRPAHERERAQLVQWMEAFTREAGLFGADQAATMVDVRMARDALQVWDDDGPVSMVGSAGPVGGVTRIGPVYTPPEYRRRGYAGTAVAVVSRRALESGAQRCMLFTDLANPTSNKIYAEVGYRRVGEWEQHVFDLA